MSLRAASYGKKRRGRDEGQKIQGTSGSTNSPVCGVLRHNCAQSPKQRQRNTGYGALNKALALPYIFNMGEYRPLRGGIFVYDVLRLIVMLETAVLFALPVDGSEGAAFPLLAYMAPNALFPMMALLFWLRPEEYRPYIFLYIAGKIVGIMANLGWLAFSVKNAALDVMIRGNFSSRLFLGLVLVMVFLDGLSLLGGFLLNRGQIRAVKAARIEEEP
jgi:hypothetical protein